MPRTPPPPPPPETVTLSGGLTVPVPALTLLLDLERRGFDLHLDDDGAVLCLPWRRLTAADWAGVTAYRTALAALVRYCDAML